MAITRANNCAYRGRRVPSLFLALRVASASRGSGIGWSGYLLSLVLVAMTEAMALLALPFAEFLAHGVKRDQP